MLAVAGNCHPRAQISETPSLFNQANVLMPGGSFSHALSICF